ncbi:MAG: hypothetical protein ACTSQL_12225, partial [Promethearchaeota archaeon]
QKKFEDSRKLQKVNVDIEKLTQLETQRIEGGDDKKFQQELIELVEKAEKMARDYEVALKKELKKGTLIEESPFSKIIGVYNQIRESVISKGWKDQVAIYTNQVKIYQEKWEKDKKLRKIESEKDEKQKQFIEAQKAPSAYDGKSIRIIKELTKEEQAVMLKEKLESTNWQLRKGNLIKNARF